MKSPKEENTIPQSKFVFGFSDGFDILREYIPRYGIFINLTWCNSRNENAVEKVKASEKKIKKNLL